MESCSTSCDNKHLPKLTGALGFESDKQRSE